MEEYVKQLRAQLEVELSKIDPEGNAVKGYDLCAKLTGKYIITLKSYLRDHPFPDKATEIHYFKEIAPTFYRDYFYFQKLYRLESYKITREEEKFQKLLRKEWKKSNKYLKKHDKLHRYFYSLKDSQDEDLFIRRNSEKWQDSLSIDMDEYFCPASRNLALVFAHVQYRDFVKEELKRVNLQLEEHGPDSMKCDLSKTDAIVLATSLHEAKLFKVNGHPATLKQIVAKTEQYFNMDLKDYTGLDQSSRLKTGDASLLFSKLRTHWQKRHERLIEENAQKK